MGQRTEVLRAKEALVVGIVKSLDDAIAPRFTLRDKDDFGADMQTEPDQEAEASGVAIGAPEGELIIDLEISGDPQTLPLAQERLADGHIMLRGDCFQSNSITAGIDEMEAVEANSAREVARPHQVQLLCNPRFPRFDFRIARARELGQNGRAKLVQVDDAIDRPDAGKRVDTKLPELPLEGNCSSLGVLLPKQSLSHFTYEPFDVPRKLSGLMVWGTRAILRPGPISGGITAEPIVEPSARLSQSTTYGHN